MAFFVVVEMLCSGAARGFWVVVAIVAIVASFTGIAGVLAFRQPSDWQAGEKTPMDELPLRPAPRA